MKIAVAVKYTPNPYQVKIHVRTGTLLIEDVEFGVNPKDFYALEAALRLKEKTNAEVVAVTVGGEEADEALREALGMGVDRGVHLFDKALGFIESAVSAEILSEYVKKVEKFDLILTGMESSDLKGGVFSTRLAALLDYPFAVGARDIEVEDGSIIVVQDFFPKISKVKIPLPAVVSVSDRFGEPRYPNMWAISEAYKDDKVKKVPLEDLGLDRGIIEKYLKLRRYALYSDEEGVRRRLSGPKDEVAKSIVEVIKDYL